MNNSFCPLLESFVHFSDVLPSWGPDCPDDSSFCPLSSSGLDGRCHAFTVPRPVHAVKFLYTTTFHLGLKVATHCCVVLHLCFIRDQPDTTKIRQIQLPSRGHSAHARGQVSVYRHLSIRPRDRNPVIRQIAMTCT